MSEFCIPGVRLGVAQAGIKYEGRDDLTLIEIAEGSSTAAVFTLNGFRAAPVVVAERHNANQDARYILINSGNLNLSFLFLGSKKNSLIITNTIIIMYIFLLP